MITLLTLDDLAAHDAAITDLDARVTALEAAGLPLSVANEVSAPVPFVDINVPAPHTPKWLRLTWWNVCSDWEVAEPAQTGALLTAYCSVNHGGTFIEWQDNDHYNNAGMRNWSGGADKLLAFNVPYRLDMGCRLSIDTGSKLEWGTSGEALFLSAGTVSGNPVHTSYVSRAFRHANGGIASSPQPSGAPWFPQDDPASPFGWANDVLYAGYFSGAPGQQVNGLRLRMNGGNNQLPKLVSGSFRLEWR